MSTYEAWYAAGPDAPWEALTVEADDDAEALAQALADQDEHNTLMQLYAVREIELPISQPIKLDADKIREGLEQARRGEGTPLEKLQDAVERIGKLTEEDLRRSVQEAVEAEAQPDPIQARQVDPGPVGRTVQQASDERAARDPEYRDALAAYALARAVRTYRATVGISRTELARRLGCPIESIIRLEEPEE